MYRGTELSSEELEGRSTYYQANREDYTTQDDHNFMCGQCGKKYTRMHNLRRHQSLECEKVPKYSCVLCHKTFYRRYVLKNHINSKHPGY